jgi:hypothetical protein
MVAKILTLVPPNASILTQNDIFPLVSSRTNSFVVPLGSFYPPGTSFDNTLNQWLQESDFVLVDFRTSLIESSLIFSYMEDFGVYASSDGIVLLKHSYLGSPLLFEPYSVELNSTQLVLKNGEIVPDADSISRKVFAHFGNSTDIDPSGLFWRSRDVSLPPGEYEISFRIRVTNNLPRNIIDINCTGLPLLLTLSRQGTETGGYKVSFKTAISKNRSVYIWRDLKGENFSRNDAYELFKAKFSTDTTLFLQVGSQVISNSTDVFLDFIRISQTKPMP